MPDPKGKTGRAEGLGAFSFMIPHYTTLVVPKTPPYSIAFGEKFTILYTTNALFALSIHKIVNFCLTFVVFCPVPVAGKYLFGGVKEL